MALPRTLTIWGGWFTLGAIAFYAVFRIFILMQSLASVASAVDAAVIIAFWLGEMFILFHAFGYFTSIMRATKRYERATLHYAGSVTPKVDVCIPVHDEPLSVVVRTLVACKYMDYPNFEVFLIDGSDEKRHCDAYRDMCEEHGFTYYRVPEPRHGAKAGALNAFLRDKIRSKYFVVFDADFRPSRDFIKSLVPQLESDETAAFVQTPQYYGNTQLSVVSRAAELQQSIFYEYLCEAKSASGGLFMCGTNLMIRTKAIRDVGGFDETSITEDFATSLRLIRAGWVGKYYNYTAAFGDGPLNLREYFRQQYRWARGTLGLFLAHFGFFVFRPGMTLAQRWEFFLSGSYYFVGLSWFVLVVLPPLYIFFRVPVYSASPFAYFAAYIPYSVLSATMFLVTLLGRRYRGREWIRSESLALLTVPVLARASIDALFGRKAVFEKTRKVVDPFEIPWDVLGPQLFLIVCNVAAVFLGGWYLLQGGFNLPLAINVFWSGFHGALLLSILFEIYAKSLSRRA